MFNDRKQDEWKQMQEDMKKLEQLLDVVVEEEPLQVFFEQANITEHEEK